MFKTLLKLDEACKSLGSLDFFHFLFELADLFLLLQDVKRKLFDFLQQGCICFGELNTVFFNFFP